MSIEREKLQIAREKAENDLKIARENKNKYDVKASDNATKKNKKK